ncbi:hypothetical protein [Kiloniella antarctica]|uniref:Anti sigma-E protein RseA N-terminal domain-containing protein n=1 Tax=Kiloniella antarctica TaxID=1550907 RepID=A0ABW5BPE5_9PROT
MMDRPPLDRQDKEKLQFLLDCYGAYEHHWPKEKRTWMLEQFNKSTEAQKLRQNAIELDNLLDLAPSEPNVDHLMETILADVPVAKNKGSLLWNWWPYESLWRPLSALTMAGAFGLILGTSSPNWIYDQENIELQEDYIAFSEASFSSDFLEGEIN